VRRSGQVFIGIDTAKARNAVAVAETAASVRSGISGSSTTRRMRYRSPFGN